MGGASMWCCYRRRRAREAGEAGVAGEPGEAGGRKWGSSLRPRNVT